MGAPDTRTGLSLKEEACICRALGQVPDSLRRELANVCRACFSGEGVARHGALVAAYRAQFVAELNPEVRLHHTSMTCGSRTVERSSATCNVCMASCGC
jgi:hypothetical protein